jgi:biopolymer transport protein ExbB/TolQ
MSRPASAPAAPRSRALILALLLGIPLGVGLLVAAEMFLPQGSVLRRYLQHLVEKVEVIAFCCAVVTLAVKLLDVPRQHLAMTRPVLPTWDGKPVPASEADKYLNMARQQPFWVRGSAVGRRRETVLHFVASRQSAAELDDHLRAQADADALALEGSYGLTRFITWAVPILGFLGTVLGITEAIAGVTPEVLEQSLSSVTDGLALAFDTTALALALTMITMLGSFLTERVEQGVLEAVDRQIDEELAHRFQRTTAATGPSTDAMLVLVEKQAEVWSKSLEAIDKRAEAVQQEQQEVLTSALAQAIERALARHEDRLEAMEQTVQARHAQLLEQVATLAAQVVRMGQDQQAAVKQLADGLLAQGKVWQQIQGGEQHLLTLQAALQQNLATLVATGSFDKAMHSLMAAIHLLTNRVEPSPAVLPLRPASPTPGKAA